MSAGSMHASTDQVLSHMVQNIQPAWHAIHIVAYVLGVCLMLVAVSALIKHGHNNQEHRHLKKMFLAWVAGSCLLSLGAIMNVLSETFYQDTARSSIHYSPPSNNPDHTFILFAVTVVIVLGLYALIKGFVQLSSSAEDSRLFWPAISHIIGGIFCVNIVQTLHVIGHSLGPNIAHLTNALVGG